MLIGLAGDELYQSSLAGSQELPTRLYPGTEVCARVNNNPKNLRRYDRSLLIRHRASIRHFSLFPLRNSIVVSAMPNHIDLERAQASAGQMTHARFVLMIGTI
jgi:hypothetical protein